MKPTNILKILLCLLLCLVMLFSVVACGKNTEDPEDTEETEEGFIDYYEGSFEEELYRPADKKYNRTLTIMARDIAHYDVGEDYILTSGTLMNDAVYERAALMQEKFGVEILVNKGNDDVYQTPALGGQYVCDFLLVNGQRTFRLSI